VTFVSYSTSWVSNAASSSETRADGVQVVAVGRGDREAQPGQPVADSGGVRRGRSVLLLHLVGGAEVPVSRVFQGGHRGGHGGQAGLRLEIDAYGYGDRGIERPDRVAGQTNGVRAGSWTRAGVNAANAGATAARARARIGAAVAITARGRNTVIA
jgi:hypothetical protein